MSAKNEVSSDLVASLASRVLKGYEPNAFEARMLAASVLTQAPDKPKVAAKRAAKKAKARK